MREVRPFGSPPPIISSRPLIPDWTFSIPAVPGIAAVLFFFVRQHHPHAPDETITRTVYIKGNRLAVLSGGLLTVGDPEQSGRLKGRPRNNAESKVPGTVFRGSGTDHPQYPAGAMQETAAVAATTFLYMILILNTFLTR
jgi:hypothetical protein